jgi:hypothetical protein
MKPRTEGVTNQYPTETKIDYEGESDFEKLFR